MATRAKAVPICPPHVRDALTSAEVKFWRQNTVPNETYVDTIRRIVVMAGVAPSVVKAWLKHAEGIVTLRVEEHLVGDQYWFVYEDGDWERAKDVLTKAGIPKDVWFKN